MGSLLETTIQDIKDGKIKIEKVEREFVIGRYKKKLKKSVYVYAVRLDGSRTILSKKILVQYMEVFNNK